MGTNMSEYASQVNLVTPMDKIGIESNTATTPALGTPIQRSALSNETLKF